MKRIVFLSIACSLLSSFAWADPGTRVLRAKYGVGTYVAKAKMVVKDISPRQLEEIKRASGAQLMDSVVRRSRVRDYDAVMIVKGDTAEVKKVVDATLAVAPRMPDITEVIKTQRLHNE